jgi:translocation and assembly module TamB
VLDRLLVEHPEATLAHSKAGVWNFQKLIKPSKGPAGRPFTDIIAFHRGVLYYFDDAFPRPRGVPARTFSARVSQLEGVVHMRADTGASWDATGLLPSNIGASFHSVGIYSPLPQSLDIQVSSGSVSMPFVSEQFVPRSIATLQSGTAAMTFNFLFLFPSGKPHRSEGLPFQFSGAGMLSNVVATGPAIGGPVRNASGPVSFADDSINLDVKGTYNGLPVTARGRAWNLLTPTPDGVTRAALQIEGDVQRFSVQPMLAGLPPLVRRGMSPDFMASLRGVTGAGAAHYRVVGRVISPAVQIQGNLSQLAWAGHTARNVAVAMSYADHKIDTGIRANYARGDTTVRAHVNIDPVGAFQVEVHGRGMHVAEAGIPGRFKLGGVGDVDLAMSGQRGRTPQISAQVQLAKAAFEQIPFDTVYARADTHGHDLVMQVLRADDAKGSAIATGTMDLRTYALNAEIDADDLDLDSLRGLLVPASPHHKVMGPPVPSTEPPSRVATVVREPGALGGMGYIRARLTGKITAPILTGRAGAFALNVAGVDIDEFMTDFKLTRSGLDLTNGVLDRHLGSVAFSGRIANPFDRAPSLHLLLRADRLDVPDLLEIAGTSLNDFTISGNISTTGITVTGTPAHLHVPEPFTLTLNDATINGQPVTGASMIAKYDTTGLTIVRAQAGIASGSLEATGHIDTDGKMALRAEGKGLSIDGLSIMSPSDVGSQFDGSLEFTAEIGGSIHAPELSADLHGAAITVNGFSVGDVRGSASYANRRVAIPALTIQGANSTTEEQVRLQNLNYDLDSGGISGLISWARVPIQRLRELVEASAADVDSGEKLRDALSVITGPIVGVVSGSADISGTSKHPRADVQWTARDISVNDYPVTAFTGHAVVDDTHLQVPTASLTSKEAGIEIDASHIEAVYDGDLTGEVSAYKVDLAFLQRWMQRSSTHAEHGHLLTGQFSGVGDIGITASGKTRSPVLEVSVNLRNVGYADPAAPTTAFPVIAHIDMDHAVIQEGSIAGSLRVLATDKSTSTPLDYALAVNGSVGFSWQSPFIAPDAPLDISTGSPDHAKLSVPLQALAFFSPYALLLTGQDFSGVSNAALADSSGSISVAAHVSNTVDHPQLTGTLDINAPRLKLKRYNTGLADVVGTLDLTGDRVAVHPGFQAHTQVFAKTAADFKPAGAPISVTGSLPFGFGEGPAQPGLVKITCDRVAFEESPIPSALNGSVRGEASTDNLQITGTLREMFITGDVRLRNSDLVIPTSFADTPTSAQPVPGYPRFGLTFHADNNVSVRGPAMAAVVTGTMDLGGSMTDPTFRGTIDLKSGTLNLPTHRFTIQPPGSISIAYPVYIAGNGNAPSLQVTADVRAQTNFFATSIYGVRRNYNVTVAARGPLLGDITDPVTGLPRFSLTFTSDPPDLSTDQADFAQKLVGVVGGTDMLGQFGRNPGQVVLDEFAQVLTGNVLQGLSEKITRPLGLTDFALGYDPVERLNLTVSRQLFGPLYVTYFRTLNGVTDIYDLKFSFRFKQRYQLSYDEHYEYGQYVDEFLVEGVWQF